jgi:hypothetical protein
MVSDPEGGVKKLKTNNLKLKAKENKISHKIEF